MNYWRFNGFFFTIVAYAAMSFFPVTAFSQQNTGKAGRVSESQSPENIGQTSYSPPKSKSRNPVSQRAKSGRTSSDKSFVMNEPRGPLNPSERARYYGIGSLELGLNVGITYGITDISGKSINENLDINQLFVNNASPGFGFYARYKINNWFGVSSGIDYTRMAGFKSEGFAYQYGTVRNNLGVEIPLHEMVYSFSNDLLEFSGKMELHTVLPKNPGIGFYGFAGFAAYYSMPSIYGLNDELIKIPSQKEIQEVDNEIQGIYEAPAVSFALPVGVGATVMVAKFVRIGLELGYRFTSNHGIDGVYVMETRYDSYVHTRLRIGYVFPSGK